MIDYKLLYPDIAHKFPEEQGNNPFDVDTNERYFIYSRGFTYTSNNLGYFKYPFDKGYSNIPMGYRSLEVLGRVLIMRDREVLLQLEEDLGELAILNPSIVNNKDQALKWHEGGYAIYSTQMIAYDKEKPSRGHTYCHGYFDKNEEVSKVCDDLSGKDPINLYMIVRIIMNVNWH